MNSSTFLSTDCWKTVIQYLNSKDWIQLSYCSKDLNELKYCQYIMKDKVRTEKRKIQYHELCRLISLSKDTLFNVELSLKTTTFFTCITENDILQDIYKSFTNIHTLNRGTR
jgi:hypothetical protein